MARSSQTRISTKMRTPRLYVGECRQGAGVLTLSERNHHYLSWVLRVREGQSLVVFNGVGFEAQATVASMSKKQTLVTLSSGTVTEDIRLPITLGLCLIKSNHFDWALQKATELGVKAIQPILGTYSDSPPKDEKLRKKKDHWQEILVNACEQSGNNWIPKLKPLLPLSELELDREQLVFAHPQTETIPIDPSRHSFYLVGPEGGFHMDEIALLKKNQVKPMSLGPRILRAETAVIVGLTLLGQQYGYV